MPVSGRARARWEERVGFWMELSIGLAVITLLVIFMGPGLWSSRVSWKQPDDAPKGRGSKPDKRS